jgi:MFS transporter, DHA1 family, multidrug resistance protein
MIKPIVIQHIRRSHHWRSRKHEELAELYISMMFRSLAFSLVGVFVPIYLYTIGYSFSAIFLFYAILFFTKTVFGMSGAHIVARIGPKHTIAMSYLLQVLPLAMIVSLESVQWPLPFIAIFWGMSNCLFFLAYHVAFSRVKHAKHGGKEIGWMNIVERFGAMLGPLVGGIVAALFGPQYTFAAALVVFTFGIVPLFLSGEPVRTHQKINFGKFHIKPIVADATVYALMNTNVVIAASIWPLFIAAFIISDNPFASIGSIVAFSVLLSMLFSGVIGRIIDAHHGRKLINASAILAAPIYIVRFFAVSVSVVTVVNVLGELFMQAKKLPITKSFYDRADQFPGNRIVYVTCVEMVANFSKALFFFILFAALTSLPAKQVFLLGFVLASAASLCLAFFHFPHTKTKHRESSTQMKVSA